MSRDKQIEEMAKHCCFPCLMGNGKCTVDLNSSECYVAIETANHLYNAGYRKASDVARGIFEEIENTINNELQKNYKVLPQFEFSNELWNKVSGRIEALKEICDFIAELKKKYTEEGK